MKEIKIKVKGMHCAGCENRIKNSLELLDEVESITASSSEGEVVVTLNKEIDLEVIKYKIEDLGFEVVE